MNPKRVKKILLKKAYLWIAESGQTNLSGFIRLL
jgi:hypothetical protein